MVERKGIEASRNPLILLRPDAPLREIPHSILQSAHYCFWRSGWVPIFGPVPTRRLEAIEVFGERHRTRIHPRDHRSRFSFASQRAQHSMRQHDLSDAGGLGYAADH